MEATDGELQFLSSYNEVKSITRRPAVLQELPWQIGDCRGEVSSECGLLCIKRYCIITESCSWYDGLA